jgi:hypothetical protein
VQKFTTLRGIAAPLMRANIDTGAIIAPIYMLSRSISARSCSRTGVTISTAPSRRISCSISHDIATARS